MKQQREAHRLQRDNHLLKQRLMEAGISPVPVHDVPPPSAAIDVS